MPPDQGVVHKVHRPAFVRCRRRGTHSARRCALAALRAAPLEREAFFPIETVDALVIHRPAFAAQQHVQPLVAVAHARLCRIPNYLCNRASEATRRRRGRFSEARDPYDSKSCV
jgi:hypothetical protein